ncbi:MAG TPA: FG-GAP-like repeat-containing protein [Terriglobia bacterium]|nr:FG-GAP-like repeat-containing protein [Terriglobia bacterium]
MMVYRNAYSRLAAALALMMASALTALAGEFATAVNYGTGTTPIAVAVADFNGNGKPDLAVTDFGNGKVSILLGNGDGTFQTAVSYGAGSRPISVAIGDFNGDGILDLAIANNVSSGTVSILLGNGDGTFKQGGAYSAASSPRSVAAGDFNGDGKLDLAVANQTSNNVSILIGNGDGTFQAPVNYKAGTAPVFVAAAALESNGPLDLVVADASGGSQSTVSVLLGKGDGTFQTAVSYSTGSRPEAVAVADFNGDGIPDLAAADYDANQVSVLLGTGNGVFGTAVNYSVGTEPVGIAAADFNGDGKADLVTANFGKKNVSVLLGNGDGTFQSAVTYSAGSGPRAVAAIDVNGDNAPDLEVPNDLGNNLSILLNTGGTLVNTTSSPNPSNPGQTVTFTTTVTASQTGSPTPTGSVTWTDNGANVLGTVTLSSGKASLKVSTLTSGTHTITTAYSGDTTYNPNSAPPLTQTVTGNGSGVTLTPSSLNFGTQTVGTTSSAQVATLTNGASTTLTITSIATSTNFVESNDCGGGLLAGGSCTISVSFKPAKSGPLTGTLTVTDSASGSPQTSSLSGTGTFVSLSPSSLAFGSQKVNTTSPPQNITLSNKSTSSSLKINGISIAGTDPTDFAETNNCGTSLAAGGSCSIMVTFTPTKTGARSATVSVADNGAGSPQTASLSGTGTN